MSERKDRNFLEGILELGEAAADFATDNEMVKAVPVVGTAIRILKGRDELRDRALAAKLLKFITEPALLSERVQRKLREGLAEDADTARKIGESLFLVLEHMTDLDKPSLLAKVFVAYIDGEISATDLRRIAHAMDSAFTDDLIALQDWEESMHASYGSNWKQPLVGAGFTAITTSGGYGITSVEYEVTELGRAFHRALWHANHLPQ